MGEKVLVLRTCNADMSSHHTPSFVWPESGPVECPEWNPEPVCGGGLHGFLWGEGDGGLADFTPTAKWLVVEVFADEITHLDGKVKFPRGTVVFAGPRYEATAYLASHGGHGRAIIGGTATAGDGGTATAGDYGTATAGDRGTATAGYRGTATAGKYGTATAGKYGTATAGKYGTATAGDRGTATAGFQGTATAGYRGTATAEYRGTATAGECGTATAGECGTATAGKYGTATAGYKGTATVGEGGTATAGEGGIIRIRWWDGARYRDAVGYVGEDGIKPATRYRVENGLFVEVQS